MGKLLSRKFFVFVTGCVLGWGAYYVTLILAPTVITSYMFIAILSAQTLYGMAYIGGNIWHTFIKSKYFHNELLSEIPNKNISKM